MKKTLIAPTISHEESQRRRRAVEEARAPNFRQGDLHDEVLEEANERFIQGLFSLDDLKKEMRQAVLNNR
ncbi:hypothetical protein [Acetobacter pasteurianus]|uniref:antitoxin VbhA family protein n=1 Tax=Acetobacter pasteurianus TaxID=438 RepID=UPI003D147BF3